MCELKRILHLNELNIGTTQSVASVVDRTVRSTASTGGRTPSVCLIIGKRGLGKRVLVNNIINHLYPNEQFICNVHDENYISSNEVEYIDYKEINDIFFKQLMINGKGFINGYGSGLSLRKLLNFRHFRNIVDSAQNNIIIVEGYLMDLPAIFRIDCYFVFRENIIANRMKHYKLIFKNYFDTFEQFSILNSQLQPFECIIVHKKELFLYKTKFI